MELKIWCKGNRGTLTRGLVKLDNYLGWAYTEVAGNFLHRTTPSPATASPHSQ